MKRGFTTAYMTELTIGQYIRLAVNPVLHLSLKRFLPAAILSLAVGAGCIAAETKSRVNWINGIMQAWCTPTLMPMLLVRERDGKLTRLITRVKKR